MQPLMVDPSSVQISSPTHPLIPAIHTPEDRKCMMVHFFTEESEVYAVAFYPHNGQFFWAPLGSFEADHDWMKPTVWATHPQPDGEFGLWHPDAHGWQHRHPDGRWWSHVEKICEAQDGTTD